MSLSRYIRQPRANHNGASLGEKGGKNSSGCFSGERPRSERLTTGPTQTFLNRDPDDPISYLLMLGDALRQRLEAAFVSMDGDAVEVNELEGCGDSFEVRIVSTAFEGTKRLQRHKKVNEAVGDDLMRRIHALSIKVAKTPSEAMAE